MDMTVATTSKGSSKINASRQDAGKAAAQQRIAQTNDVTSMSDSDLDAQLKALRAERKRRDEIAAASAPKEGDTVRVIDAENDAKKKHVGKTGKVILPPGRNRIFVGIEGKRSPLYLRYQDVEVVK